ncbi:MAG: hypothetical protein ABIP03_14240 [Aquihabitans sp.]
MIVLIAAIFVIAGLTFVIVTMSRPVPLVVGAEGRPAVRDVLVARFIDRSQRFRRSGAIVGLVLMATYLIALDASEHNGIDLNLLVFASIGLAGSIGGSILAESFRVRRRGPRTASLDVRDPDAYKDRAADRREQVLLVVAVFGVVGAIVTGEHLQRALGLGAVVVVLAAVRRWAVRRIALRPRPVVSADVADADDEVRRLAASAGISRPMVTLGALAISAQWSAIVSGEVEPTRAIAVASVIAWLGSIVLFLTACGWWWTNRSFGLVPAHLQAGAASRSHLRWWALGTVVLCIVMMAALMVARSTG